MPHQSSKKLFENCVKMNTSIVYPVHLPRPNSIIGEKVTAVRYVGYV